MINVFRSAELGESKPKNDDSLEKIVESYSTDISFNPRRIVDGGGIYATSTKLSLTSIRRG